MTRKYLYNILFFISVGFIYQPLAAQKKDTSGTGGVEIISAFKPILREAAKINFNPSPLPPDNTKPDLQYNIPNQNLLFAYQPGVLKPLALNIDSSGRFDNANYIKAGFGSLRTPYIQAGISLGDGETAGLNIYAKHVGSDGKRADQKFSNTQVDLKGYFRSGNNLEWNAGIGMTQARQYKYGYEPQTLSFSNDSLKQNFQTISARVGFHNINKTEFGLTYSPEVKIDIFSDVPKNAESNTVVNLPLQKTIGEDVTVDLGLTFDLTRLSPKNKTAINNTIYYISPSVLYKTSKINAQIGIRPSWDNKSFKMFPNILADISTDDHRFTFQAGWTGYIRKTTYMYLAGINPWLYMPDTYKNTWIEERFAGFKGSVGNHFSYAAKVGFNKINNQPLFVNDTVTALGGKSFRVVNESKMNVLNFDGQVGVNFGEKFSLITGVTFNQFSGLQDQAKAWGLIPLELKAAMRLQIIKDLWLKSDLFAWDGPRYRMKDGTSGKLDPAVDLSAGLEFKITKNLSAWTQFNNLFNKEYQRWNQYPVYGFNFVGGIVFSFDQKTK